MKKAILEGNWFLALVCDYCVYSRRTLMPAASHMMRCSHRRSKEVIDGPQVISYRLRCSEAVG